MRDHATSGRLAAAGVVALVATPLALAAWLCFRQGGFFAGEPAVAVLVLAAALAARVSLAPRPFDGLGGWVLAPAGLLLALAAWMLLSATWSDATGRAVVEHTRPVAYALALLLLGTLALRTDRLRWVVRAAAAVLAGVALAGLLSRVAPELVEAPVPPLPGRLSYPLSYWNGTGLVAALATLLGLHLACDAREPTWVRAAGAALVPALATTVLLTFSRGALAAGVLAGIAYLLLARDRGAALGIAAAGPASAVLLVLAYHADEITSARPTSAAAVTEGHGLLAATVAAMFVAATTMAVGAGWVRSWERARRASDRRWTPRARRLAGAAAALAVLAVLALGVAADAPRTVSDRFLAGDEVPTVTSEDLRARLSSVGNSGRRYHWRVALDAFADEPLRGEGAGTYQLRWSLDRPYDDAAVDAHSLYLEVLGELGVVGLVLLLGALVGVLVGLVLRARGEDRALFAAVSAVWLAWMLHAGLDWVWELPGVTVVVFTLAGAALARPTAAAAGPGRSPIAPRVAVVAACAAVTILPAAVARSQHELDASLDALRARDCAAGAAAAQRAIDALRVRAEPWEALGYCLLISGEPRLAGIAMRRAAERDPHSWEPRYGLALAAAAANRDPRPELRAALRLNPNEGVLRNAMERAEAMPPPRWPAFARASPLLVPAERDAAVAALRQRWAEP